MSIQVANSNGILPRGGTESAHGNRNTGIIGAHLMVAPPARTTANYPMLRRPSEVLLRPNSSQPHQVIIEEKSINASR